MKQSRIFTAPLIQRLSIQFLMLGVLPILVLTVIPLLYIVTHGIEPLGETLLFLGLAQSAMFLLVVLVGALVTLRRLALPIQELVKGAGAIIDGDLSYRVPIRHGDREMVRLTEMFNLMAAAVETMHNDVEEQRLALEAALDEREREFDVILDIAGQVNRQTDPTRSIQQALATARANLGTDIISLVMLEENGQIASIASACGECGFAAPCQEHCVSHRLLHRAIHRMQPTLLRQVAETREGIHIYDTHHTDALVEPLLLETLDELGMHKLFIRPLVSQDHVLGILVLMRYVVQKVPERAETLLKPLAENIAILIENWNLQNKVRKLTIMEERHRLASELHDSVTQSLFTLSLTARGLKSSLKSIPDANQQALDVLVEQTKIIQAEMRTLINELRPVDLEADDFESALHQHIHSLRCSTNTAVQFSISGSVSDIPKPIQRNLNRIVQEALSNIARHANAPHAMLRLDIGDDMVSLTIKDDGAGFDLPAVALRQSGSLGLTSMRERAELLGGALLIRSRPNSGTAITARIPICCREEEPVGV